MQQSELKLREAGKNLEEAVSHLERELFKARQEMAQAQDSLKQTLDIERFGERNAFLYDAPLSCVCVCRKAWSEEKKVLTSRIEECQARQVTLSQDLAESRRDTKKVSGEDKRGRGEL